MKFTLEGSIAQTERSAEHYSVEELLIAKQDIHNTWAKLDASIKELDDVQQIMDNISFSMKALDKYGVDAVKVLNADKGLENLLGIPEKLITVEKAVDAMEGVMGNAFDTIKKWFRQFCQKVKTFVEKIKSFFIREKIVEKTVIKTVEKEVPVEIVKEVKVYVDKIIEKKVEVPVEPTVTMEELQEIPSFSEFMKQAQILHSLTQQYNNAMNAINTDIADDPLDYIVNGKSFEEIFRSFIKSDLFVFDGNKYRGIYDLAKWYNAFSITRFDANKKYPVKNVTEWSKENYVKAWNEVSNTYADDTVIYVGAMVSSVGRIANDIENIVLKKTDEDVNITNERVQRRLKHLDKDISDENGHYSEIIQNISHLRMSCNAALEDCTRIIHMRQDFMKILNKVAHIFMKIDKYVKKTGLSTL